MKRTVLGGEIYAYEEKPIKVGDKVLTPDLEDIYTATIHDADNLGFVIVEPINN